MKDYLDRITELNFDLDNEEAQAEAKEMKKTLLKQYLILFILSIIGIVASAATLITLMILAFKGNEVLILYSIIPLVTLFLFAGMLIFALNRKALALEIIINDEEKSE